MNKSSCLKINSPSTSPLRFSTPPRVERIHNLLVHEGSKSPFIDRNPFLYVQICLASLEDSQTTIDVVLTLERKTVRVMSIREIKEEITSLIDVPADKILLYIHEKKLEDYHCAGQANIDLVSGRNRLIALIPHIEFQRIIVQEKASEVEESQQNIEIDKEVREESKALESYQSHASETIERNEVEEEFEKEPENHMLEIPQTLLIRVLLYIAYTSLAENCSSLVRWKHIIIALESNEDIEDIILPYVNKKMLIEQVVDVIQNSRKLEKVTKNDESEKYIDGMLIRKKTLSDEDNEIDSSHDEDFSINWLNILKYIRLYEKVNFKEKYSVVRGPICTYIDSSYSSRSVKVGQKNHPTSEHNENASAINNTNNKKDFRSSYSIPSIFLSSRYKLSFPSEIRLSQDEVALIELCPEDDVNLKVYFLQEDYRLQEHEVPKIKEQLYLIMIHVNQEHIELARKEFTSLQLLTENLESMESYTNTANEDHLNELGVNLLSFPREKEFLKNEKRDTSKFTHSSASNQKKTLKLSGKDSQYEGSLVKCRIIDQIMNLATELDQIEDCINKEKQIKQRNKENLINTRKGEKKVKHFGRGMSQFIDEQISDLKQISEKDGTHAVKDLATKTFEEFDIDGDGEISMEEFRLLIGEKRALIAIAENNRADQLHINKILRTKLESDPYAIERDHYLQKIFIERTELNSELDKATEELKNAETELRSLQRQINYKKEEIQNELLMKTMKQRPEKRVTSII